MVLSSISEKLSGSFALFWIPETSWCGETTKSHSIFSIFFWIHTSILWKSTVSWLLFAGSFFHHFSCYPPSQASKIFQASFSHFLIFFGCFQFADVLVRLNFSAFLTASRYGINFGYNEDFNSNSFPFICGSDRIDSSMCAGVLWITSKSN